MICLLGLARQWWVPGWLYKGQISECASREEILIRDRDEWKALAMSGTTLAEQQFGMLRPAPRKRR